MSKILLENLKRTINIGKNVAKSDTVIVDIEDVELIAFELEQLYSRVESLKEGLKDQIKANSETMGINIDKNQSMLEIKDLIKNLDIKCTCQKPDHFCDNCETMAEIEDCLK